MLLTYFLNDFEIVPVIIIIIIIIIVVVVVLGGLSSSVGKVTMPRARKISSVRDKRFFSPQEPSSSSGDNPVYLFT